MRSYIKGSSWTRSDILLPYIKGDVVEVGCGNGELANRIAEDHKIRLFDIQNILAHRNLDNVFQKLDISTEKIPMETESVDTVLAIAVIEHLENPSNLIKEARRILKKEGVFIVSFPNITIWDRLLFLRSGNLYRYHKKNDHIFILTPDLIYKMFGGFKIKNKIYADPYNPWIKIILPKIKCLCAKVCYIFEKV